MLDPNTKVEQYTYSTLPPNGSFSTYQSSNWDTATPDNTKGIDGMSATPYPGDSEEIYYTHSLPSILLGNGKKEYICGCIDENGYQYKRTSNELYPDSQVELNAKIESELNKERARQGKTPKKVLGIITGDISKEDKARITKETIDKFMANAPETAFKGTYVETGKRRIVEAPVKVVAGDTSGSRITDHQNDYRHNPQQAPFRIGIAKLKDGRVVVSCVTALGKCYGDERQGNYFEHTLIFPAGTNIEDVKAIDWKRFPFKKALNTNEMNSDIMGTPRSQRMLHQLTGQQILTSTNQAQHSNTPQQTKTAQQPTPQPSTQAVPTPQVRTQTSQQARPTPLAHNQPNGATPITPQSKPAILGVEQLYQLVVNSVFGDTDTKRNASQVLKKQIDAGANIPQLFSYIESKMINALNQGEAGIEMFEKLEMLQVKLAETQTLFDQLVDHAESYSRNKNNAISYQSSGDFEKANNARKNSVHHRSQMEQLITAIGPENVQKMIVSYRAFLDVYAQRTAIENKRPVNQTYKQSDEYFGLSEISLLIQIIQKKKEASANATPPQSQATRTGYTDGHAR